MAFHLAAYTSVLTSAGAFEPVTPVTDGLLPSTATGFVLPVDMRLVAAYAVNTALMRARIVAPGLQRTAFPLIRPVSRSLPEQTNPKVMDIVSHPLGLAATENVSVEVLTNPPPSRAYALLWLCRKLTCVPPGEKFTLRFTSIQAVTANVWSSIGTVTLDQSLPSGQYAIVGFEHWSDNAVAARLLLPGSTMRPGTLSMAGGAGIFPAQNRTDPLFYEGGLGVFGFFNSFAAPQCEVLATAADTAHEGYLTVIRTGDLPLITCPYEPTGARPVQGDVA